MYAFAFLRQPSDSIYPNDFAFLSEDIIHDVMRVAQFDRSLKRYCATFQLEGRWGDTVTRFKEYRAASNVVMDLTSWKDDYDEIASKDVNFISCLFVSGSTNYSIIRHLAPKFYEHFCFSSSLVAYKTSSLIRERGKLMTIPRSFLESLGTRFTTINWQNISAPLAGEIDFLKRQLRSQHLRNFAYCSEAVAGPEFDNLLVGFVKKKNFESLRNVSQQILSGEVFVAAYEAWLQRKEGEHLQSEISAHISSDDLRELVGRIRNFCWKEVTSEVSSSSLKLVEKYSENHPTTDEYEMLMCCSSNDDGFNQKLHINFKSFNGTEDSGTTLN